LNGIFGGGGGRFALAETAATQKKTLNKLLVFCLCVIIVSTKRDATTPILALYFKLHNQSISNALSFILYSLIAFRDPFPDGSDGSISVNSFD
jgi:hypothetical protein